MSKDKGMLVVISGFSGSGKGTVIKRLLSIKKGYVLSVSATTRQKRPGEKEGVDYFFMENADFEKKIREGYFLEYASYVDHYYGTPSVYVQRMLEEGKDVILEIEVQGALKVKKSFPEAVLIYLTPPSASELENRLRIRGTEAEENIKARMKQAMKESEGVEAYDYILLNDDVDSCVERLDNIIIASHDRVSRHIDVIRKIRKDLEEFGDVQEREVKDAASYLQ